MTPSPSPARSRSRTSLLRWGWGFPFRCMDGGGHAARPGKAGAPLQPPRRARCPRGPVGGLPLGSLAFMVSIEERERATHRQGAHFFRIRHLLRSPCAGRFLYFNVTR